MMKKNFVKKSSAFVCVALLAASMAMTGCSSKTKVADDVSMSEEATPEAVSSDAVVKETTEADTQTTDTKAADSDSIFGQITAIDGDKITIALANQPTAPSGKGGKAPSGEAPSGDKPSGEAPSGEAPSGEAPSGEKPSGDMKLDLTGETKDITVSDSTKIMLDGTSATIDDLKKEDIVRIKMDGDTVESISVGMENKGGAPKTASESSSLETTSAE